MTSLIENMALRYNKSSMKTYEYGTTNLSARLTKVRRFKNRSRNAGKKARCLIDKMLQITLNKSNKSMTYTTTRLISRQISCP